jgi:3-methyladenine DNA glycosylase AlkD
MEARSVLEELKKFSNPKKAKISAWFFKTDKGQYGEGDVFWGITVPEQRKIAKKHLDLSLPEILKLLKNKVHECRLTALIILVGKYKKTTDNEKEKIAKFYLKNTKRVNNWDLVDTSAYILGDFLSKRKRNLLYKLAKSKNLWERRISIVSTYSFIRKGEYSDTLKISKLLLNDKHDLIHKAVGWMLREVGKKSQKTLEVFLNENIKLLSRTTLRYAIEKFSDSKRKEYLKSR